MQSNQIKTQTLIKSHSSSKIEINQKQNNKQTLSHPPPSISWNNTQKLKPPIWTRNPRISNSKFLLTCFELDRFLPWNRCTGRALQSPIQIEPIGCRRREMQFDCVEPSWASSRQTASILLKSTPETRRGEGDGPKRDRSCTFWWPDGEGERRRSRSASSTGSGEKGEKREERKDPPL